jgi:short-subunit dehydrogenase
MTVCKKFEDCAMSPLMDRPLAVVTGASSGMGAEFARQLAARGYDLALVARRLDRLQALGTELESRYDISVQAISADLSRMEATQNILEALAGRPVAMLVNNAGYSLPQPFLSTPWPQQRDCIMTLAMAVCDLTHAVLPGMIERGSGAIISTSSILAYSPGGPGHTVYPAAKSFVLKFMTSLRAELQGSGIRITCLVPGSTSSEFQLANGTTEAMAAMPSWMIAIPAEAVTKALIANDRDHLICIPEWYNQIAVLAMKLTPDPIMRWLSIRAARTFGKGS